MRGLAIAFLCVACVSPGVSAAPATAHITEGGVGALELGKPLPPPFVEGDLAERYVTRFYADAQPLEGFESRQPPLVVYVEGGPFHDFGMASPGAAPPRAMSAAAAELARAGKLTVKMLLITDPTLRTDRDVGVGSTYADVVARYEAAVALTLPGLFEEPSCIVRPRPDSPLWFFFTTCTGGSDGVEINADAPVIRVVVR